MGLKRTVPIIQKCLKDLPVTLVSTSSGLIVLYVTALHDDYFINYRQGDGMVLLWLWLAVNVLLHSLSVYSSAWLFIQISPRRRIVVEPTWLMIWGVIGGFIGLMVQQTNYPISDFASLSSWIGLGIGSLLGIHLGGLAKYRRTSEWRVTLRRAAIPVGLIALLYLVNYTDFPGVDAPIQSRQQWAVRTFRGYESIASRLRSCEEIADSIGSIEFVAPTQGRNSISIESGYKSMGEFTLEVVGATGTGVAHIQMNMGSVLGDVTFTSRGRTETFSCGI